MNYLPERNKVDEALERICSHKLFKRSYTNELLLRFLVEQAYQGTDVKEQTIGIELFNKDYTPEKNDSKIRVYVYYLRKKLQTYYENDGKKEEIRFEIKKGQYNLTFINKEEIRHRIQHDEKHLLKIQKKHFIIILGLILMLVAAVFIIKKTQQPDYCWKAFFKDGANNVCVLSDHFVYGHYDENRGMEFSTNNEIRNEKQFKDYNKNNTSDPITLGHFASFSKMAPYGIHRLSKWFSDYNKDFSIVLESQLRYEDYEDNNVIFIGQAKNMKLSRSIFLKDSKMFKYEDFSYIIVRDGVEQILYETFDDKSVIKEYAFVSFTAVENGKEALFFVSQHDIGVLGTIRSFTNQAWVKDFYNKMPQGTRYFNAAFEVYGVNRSDIECKLIAIEPMN